ncbi:MAG TPA: hypothetical protein PKC69_08835 [Chitinophagaceae bacterium]|nr:hypothetical protein [Chitinophagaceae bacterium]
MNYFATPVSSIESFDNYNKTVIKGINLSIAGDLEPSILKHKTVTDRIRLWGIKGDKRTRWDKAKKGDILFFYHNKFIVSYCIILDKFESNKLAESLWGSFESVHYAKFTWPLIFILTEPILCHIPFEIFNKIIGYNDNYFLRSFFKLSDKFAYHIENNFINVNEFAKKESVPTLT